MPFLWLLAAAALGYWVVGSSESGVAPAAVKPVEPKKDLPPLKCLDDAVSKLASVKDVQTMFVKLGKLEADKADGACTLDFLKVIAAYQKEVGAPLLVTSIVDMPTYTVLKASTTKVENEFAYGVGSTAGKADALALLESMKASGLSSKDVGDGVYSSWKTDWVEETKDGYRDAFLAALGDAGYTLSVQPGEKGVVKKKEPTTSSDPVEVAKAAGKKDGEASAALSEKAGGAPVSMVLDSFDMAWEPSSAENSAYTQAFDDAVTAAGYVIVDGSRVQSAKYGVSSTEDAAKTASEAGKKDGEATVLKSSLAFGAPVDMDRSSMSLSWSSWEASAYNEGFKKAVADAGYVFVDGKVQSGAYTAPDPLVETAKELAAKDVEAAIVYFESTKVPVKDSAQSYDPTWPEAARYAYEESFMAWLDSRGYELSAADEVQPKGYVAPKIEPTAIPGPVFEGGGTFVTEESAPLASPTLELKPAPFYSAPAIKL